MGFVFFIVVNAPLCFLVSFFSSSLFPIGFFTIFLLHHHKPGIPLIGFLQEDSVWYFVPA